VTRGRAVDTKRRFRITIKYILYIYTHISWDHGRRGTDWRHRVKNKLTFYYTNGIYDNNENKKAFRTRVFPNHRRYFNRRRIRYRSRSKQVRSKKLIRLPQPWVYINYSIAATTIMITIDTNIQNNKISTVPKDRGAVLNITWNEKGDTFSTPNSLTNRFLYKPPIVSHSNVVVILGRIRTPKSKYSQLRTPPLPATGERFFFQERAFNSDPCSRETLSIPTL